MRGWLRLYGLALAAGGLGACDDEAPGRERQADAARSVDMAVVGADAGRDAQLPDAAARDAGIDAAADGGADAAADTGPDARVPVRPDELPTEGPADLPGAADLTLPVPAGRARAGRVDDEAERLTGPEAACRVGCFRLDNARISVCIQDDANFSQYTFAGGNIVDAHRADRPGTDLLSELIVAPGLGEVSVEAIGVVRDGADGGPAIIRTTGIAGGARTIQSYVPNSVLPPPLRVTTELRLAPDADHVDVLTWVESDRSARLTLYDLVLFGDRMQGFTAAAPVEGLPPLHAPWIAADGVAVSYRWSNAEGPINKFRLPADAIALEPVRQPDLFLQPGDMGLVRRRFTVGTGDVESVRPAPDDAVAVVLRGPPGLRVQIDDGTSHVTRATIDANGTRTVRLSPGDYRATPFQWAGGDGAAQPFTAAAGAEIDLAAAIPGRLRVHVEDAHGRALGAKLILRGPREIIEFVLDDAELALPPGEWRAVTTRGWHYTADDRVIQVEPGGEHDLRVVLEEVIPFEGWTSGEFHQHSIPSLDSEVPQERRILSNIAEGVGFMVPSDHDVIYDFAGLAQRMGVLDRIALPLVGVEISPLVGHLGAYGLPYDPRAGAGGAPALAVPDGDRWRVRPVAELIEVARGLGAEIVQVNHPRGGSSALFDTVRYDPAVGIGAVDSPHWSLDFDTVEVYNERDQFCRVLVDWLSLLDQGLRITGVGNSDTHGESSAPGYPRNYLPTAAVHPAGVTREEVIDALRRGRVTVGGGAVLDLPDGPQPGDEVRVEGGTLSVRVRVRTPPYARVDRLLAFLGTRVVLDRALDPDREAIVDLDEVIEVPVDRDGPLVLVVAGDRRMPYVTSDPVFAFANPVWVDVDGGGVAPAPPGPVALPDIAFCQ